MKAKPNCIACVMQQARMIMNKYDITVERQIAFEDELYAMLLNMDAELTPSHYHSEMLIYLSDRTGIRDFYEKDKREQNKQALKLVPSLDKILEKCDDRLYTALLLAAAGNIIDLTFSDNFDIGESIERCLKEGFEIDNYQEFCNDLISARKLLLIADNAGEIVFDKLLISEIKRYCVGLGRNDFSTAIMVKEGPALNDATMEDAVEIDAMNVCHICTTQSNYIGAPMELIGSDAVKVISESDIIIAKGQGNYETLGDEKSLQGRLYVLLQAKCQMVADSLSVNKRKTVFKKM